MSVLVVEVLAADIEGTDPRRDWAEPVELALQRLTGQDVDIDGGDASGNIATIGQDEWTLFVDLPDDLNRWLNARWNGDGPGEPATFRIPVPSWILDLFGPGQP